MDLKQVMTGGAGTATQNLINPPDFNPLAKPPGFYKSIVLDVFSVLAAGLFGFTYYRYLTSNLSIWFLLGGLLLYAVLTVLQVFLSKKFQRRFYIMLCETAAIIGFFYRDDIRILLVTAGVVLAFLAWGYLASRSQLTNSVEIPFFRISGNALGKLTTGTLIFMILIYVPQFNQNSVFVSQQSFRQFFDWGVGVVNNFYPGVSLTGSFGTFAQDVAKMELQNNQNFQAMSPQTQSSTINQTAQQFTANFGSTPAGQVSSTAPASDAFYNFIVGMLDAWHSQGPTWFIVGWAVVLFFALRTLGIVFVWIAQFVSLIFYEILIASGFMRITESTQTKEVLGY